MTTPGNKARAASWLAGASALLSLVACYGSLAVVALLSAMGVTLAIDAQVLTGVIVAFAVLSVLFVSMGYPHHRNHNPSRLAILGASLVIWAMYGTEGIRGVPSMAVELAGFAALLGAAWWDWKLRR